MFYIVSKLIKKCFCFLLLPFQNVVTNTCTTLRKTEYNIDTAFPSMELIKKKQFSEVIAKLLPS